MKHQSQLESSMDSLSGLKKCLSSDEISEFLIKLKNEWNPKSKDFEGEGVHGSKKGETYSYTLYWDNKKCLWTSRESAFKSYVDTIISNSLVLLYPKLFNEL